MDRGERHSNQEQLQDMQEPHKGGSAVSDAVKCVSSGICATMTLTPRFCSSNDAAPLPRSTDMFVFTVSDRPSTQPETSTPIDEARAETASPHPSTHASNAPASSKQMDYVSALRLASTGRQPPQVHATTTASFVPRARNDTVQIDLDQDHALHKQRSFMSHTSMNTGNSIIGNVGVRNSDSHDDDQLRSRLRLRHRPTTSSPNIPSGFWTNDLYSNAINTARMQGRAKRDIDLLGAELTAWQIINKPGIFIRTIRHRIVLFGHQSDCDLFDRVHTWHTQNPGLGPLDAMEVFGDEKNIDAAVKLIFARSFSPWDAIIQYTVGKTDSVRGSNGATRNEIRAAHVVGMLRRSLIAIAEVSEIHENQRFIKVLAPFGILCHEAERIQLRMPLDISKIVRHFQASYGSTQYLTSISNQSGFFDWLKPQRWPSSTTITSGISIPTSHIGIMPGAGVDNVSETNEIVWEGPTSLFMDGAISPKRSSAFTRERLDLFKGGDATVLGRSNVCFNFFSNARRNMLVYSILSQVTVHLSSSWAEHSNIDDLLVKGVYSSYYAVHDGPLATKNTDEDGGADTSGASLHPSTFANRSWDAPHTHSARTRTFDTIHSAPSEISLLSVGMEHNLRSEIYQKLRNSFKLRNFFNFLPVNEMREYFGEKIGFYFAWLGFYTIWCQSAAFLGLITFLYGIYRSATVTIEPNDSSDPVLVRTIILFDNEATPIYAFVMSVWAVLCLEFWKRQTKSIAFLWDVSDYRHTEHIRPQWCPSATRMSPITGRPERYEPTYKRYIVRIFTSIVLALVFLVLVCSFVGLLAIQDLISAIGYQSLGTVVTTLFAVIQIVVLNPLYNHFARFLNDFENYKTKSEYDDNFTIKSYLLNFVNNFTLIFNLAIFKAVIFSVANDLGQAPPLDFGRWNSACKLISPKFGITSCMRDLIIEIAIMFAFRQFLMQAMDVLWPLFSLRYREILSFNFDFDVDGDDDTKVAQYARDSRLIEYSELNYINEFTSKAIQFGYIVMFSAAFPLAPMLAYLNNLIEMRLDVWKHIVIYRRTFARRESSIGRWIDIMRSAVTIGVLTNALIIAFTSSWAQRTFSYLFPDPADSKFKLAVQLLFVLLFEHCVFLVAIIVDYFVPDVPQSVQLGQEAEEYLSRIETVMLNEKLEREAAAAHTHTSTETLNQDPTNVHVDAKDDQTPEPPQDVQNTSISATVSSKSIFSRVMSAFSGAKE